MFNIDKKLLGYFAWRKIEKSLSYLNDRLFILFDKQPTLLS